MYSAEDPGCQGLSRSGAPNTKWEDDVHGNEAAGGDNAAPTEAHLGNSKLERLQSSRGQLGGAVQDILDGFATRVWEPHAYQKRGIEWLTHKISAALFLPPGMGKTSITLAALQVLKQEGLAKRALILAPLTVCLTTWMSEPKKWRQFETLKVGLAHGPNKAAVLIDPSYDIVVMNYDGITWAAAS